MSGSILTLCNYASYLIIALITMTVVCYSLAIPRLGPALARSRKTKSERRELLQKKIREKEGELPLDEIEKELKEIKREEEEWKSVINNLSWKRILIYPNLNFFASLVLVGASVVVADSYLAYAYILLGISVLIMIAGVYFLLKYLIEIERAATMVG